MTEQNIKARKKALELREQELSVEKAEVDLRKSQIELAQVEHTNRWNYEASSSQTGRFVFDERVDASSCGALVYSLRRWHHTHPGEAIEVTLNTPGGDPLEAVAVYDELRTLSEAHGHQVTTKVRGMAASAGAMILLQAGDTRLIGAESLLMVHELSAWTGGKLHEIRNEAKFLEMLNLRFFEIMARRSGGKIPDAEQFYKDVEAKDLWITADEAVNKYGLADSIG